MAGSVLVLEEGGDVCGCLEGYCEVGLVEERAGEVKRSRARFLVGVVWCTEEMMVSLRIYIQDIFLLAINQLIIF